MKKVFSNIAVDLGAVSTGVLLTTQKEHQSVEDMDAQFHYIEVPVKGNTAPVLSLVQRTLKRHQLRSKKRFQFARRLLFILFEHRLQRPLTRKEKEAFSHYLKRRGYTYLTSEADVSVLEKADDRNFALLLPDYFTVGEKVLTQLQWLSSQPVQVQALCDAIAKINVKDPTIKKLGKEFLTQWKFFSNYVTDLVNQVYLGHKSRRQYFENIAADLPKDTRLKDVIAMVSAQDLCNIIANLSNLPLRPLRRYFSDEKMVAGDYYDDKRLHRIVRQTYRAFHYAWTDPKRCAYTKDEIMTVRRRLADENRTMVQIWKTLDPKLTIPPYEDQNNRNPPFDQTLYINIDFLRKHYPEWRSWVQAIVAKSRYAFAIDGEIVENLKSAKGRTVFAKRYMSTRQYSTQDLYWMLVLMRVLDCSYEADCYQIRNLLKLWARKGSFCLSDSLLGQDLGEKVSSFLSFAKDYFEAVQQARKGLFCVDENGLLIRADIHPPQKKNILPYLVSQILMSRTLTQEDIDAFWGIALGKNRTVRSVCKQIETVRKCCGNAFARFYRNPLLVEDKLRKEIQGIKEIIPSVVAKIESVLARRNISCRTRAFSNPFSLAQLYTLIEVEPTGFSKCSLFAHRENHYRMTARAGFAIASRLSSDVVRPFDGVVARLLDRIAHRVTQIQVQNWLSSRLQNARIQCNFLLRLNQFEFTSSLKGFKQAKTVNIGDVKDYYARKKARIEKASHDICPYTGANIGTQGEIDHIIPRSETLASFGTIFNAEANLVYCSQVGNQTKHKTRYRLEDLHPRYLRVLFATTDCQKIKERIRHSIENVFARYQSKRIDFALLSETEQRDFRHALFCLDRVDLYQNVVQALGHSYASRVNGTQAYFVQHCIQKLLANQELQKWLRENQNILRFDAFTVSARMVAQQRQKYAYCHDLSLQKAKNQNYFSHCVDASCVLSCVLDDASIREKIACNACMTSSESVLQKILTSTCQLHRLERKRVYEKKDIASRALMKDTLYKLAFLHIFTFQNQVFVGTCWDLARQNCVQLAEESKLFCSLMQRFVDQRIMIDTQVVCRYEINRSRAFAFLYRVAREKSTVLEIEQHRLLIALSYISLRQALEKILFGEKSVVHLREAAEKKDLFAIELSGLQTIPTTTKTILMNTQKTYDVYIAKLKERFGETMTKLQYRAFEKEAMDSLHQRKKSAHKKRKKGISIAVRTHTTTTFLLKRKNHVTNQDVYVLQSPEVAYDSVRVDNDVIRWQENELMSHFQNSHLAQWKKVYSDTTTKRLFFQQEYLIYEDRKTRITCMLSAAFRMRVFIRYRSRLSSIFASNVDWKMLETNVSESVFSPAFQRRFLSYKRYSDIALHFVSDDRIEISYLTSIYKTDALKNAFAVAYHNECRAPFVLRDSLFTL